MDVTVLVVVPGRAEIEVVGRDGAGLVGVEDGWGVSTVGWGPGAADGGGISSRLSALSGGGSGMVAGGDC
jgi:hypothetical protein